VVDLDGERGADAALKRIVPVYGRAGRLSTVHEPVWKTTDQVALEYVVAGVAPLPTSSQGSPKWL
jgi:hypothetical protein